MWTISFYTPSWATELSFKTGEQTISYVGGNDHVVISPLERCTLLLVSLELSIVHVTMLFTVMFTELSIS